MILYVYTGVVGFPVPRYKTLTNALWAFYSRNANDRRHTNNSSQDVVNYLNVYDPATCSYSVNAIQIVMKAITRPKYSIISIPLIRALGTGALKITYAFFGFTTLVQRKIINCDPETWRRTLYFVNGKGLLQGPITANKSFKCQT